MAVPGETWQQAQPEGTGATFRLLLAFAGLIVAAAAGLAVYSEVTAPNQFLPSRSLMIGTWRSSSGAVLILRPGGSFTVRGLPADAGESSYGTVPSEGSGRWHVGPVPAEPPGVVFNFSPKVQMELLVERLGSTAVMYYDKGDPDEGVSGQYQFTMFGDGQRAAAPGSERSHRRLSPER